MGVVVGTGSWVVLEPRTDGLHVVHAAGTASGVVQLDCSVYGGRAPAVAHLRVHVQGYHVLVYHLGVADAHCPPDLEGRRGR